MKKSIIASAGLTVSAVVSLLLLRREPAPQAGPEPADLKPGWSAAVNEDTTAVFQRAFWRKPGAGDRILHAERVEWSDPADGVAKWQWFLVVEPGQELDGWLRQENPFSLQKAARYAAEEDSKNARRPAWFPAIAGGADCEILRTGRMTLIFNTAERRLFATDSGYGLRPGVAAR